MKHNVLQDADRYTKAHQRKKRWYKAVTCLACVVVFCTVYALILPAVTMENRNCEVKEHTHSESCYTQVTAARKEPVCTMESLNLHQHEDSCRNSEGDLTCGYADFIVHTHDSSCFDEDGTLWCPLPEIKVHEHTESCYAQQELICEEPEIILHEHTADCFDEDGNLICEKVQVLEHQHTDDCFEMSEESSDAETLTCTNTDEGHTHTALCYGTWELTCGMEEHIHSEKCQSADDNLEQGDLNMTLPEGAQIPDEYDIKYSYIAPDNRFGVMVYASEGSLPDNAVLSAQLLEQGSEAYEAAQQALTDTAYDGFAAMDIHFTAEGEEIEPESSVYVCINVMGLLPENANADTLAVQHHGQSGTALLSPDKEESSDLAGTVTVETVADAAQKTGQVEALDTGAENTQDVAVAFEVESFSTFTVTWQDSYKLILHYVDTAGNSIYTGDEETALATYSELEHVTLSQYANRISHTGYAYDSAYIVLNGQKQTVLRVKYDKNEAGWEYSNADADWVLWMDGTNHTADVYLSYTKAENNEIVPPENNVYPVDAINTWDENANVILVYPKNFSETDISANSAVNLHQCLPGIFNDNSTVRSDWTVYRIEERGGRYQVLQKGDAQGTTGVQKNDAYLLLVKREYIKKHALYDPEADWPEDQGDTSIDGAGDTVSINLQCSNSDVKTSSGTPLAYFTFSPKNNTATADARADDVAAVDDSAIRFQLFNYSTKINRPNGGDEGWRSISPYFQFRGQEDSRKDLGESNNSDRDDRYDQDGFTVNHATVLRTLVDNYPVLDPNRNALGNAKSPEVTEEALPQSERSLAYLFSGGDGAVTAYSPTNTILQKSGTHYYYNSAYNAVDYDINNSLFRVRNYVERNSSTAGYGNAQRYFDFLPFNYTDGEVIGTSGSDGRTYNLATSDVDYWFGMRMDVDFYQSKDGILNDEEMIFHFSGDDDVWVFIDDVLVLDLGGTHGTVTGYINFATGEIQQYLDWNGTVGTEGETSFSTTIKDCYKNAGKDPNGGWNGDIFADYTKHKLSFFYMERGCSVANCAIDFNLPTLPEKSLQVTKELVAKDGADADVVKHLEDTMEYKFRVVKANADGQPADELLIKEGDEYILSGAGISGTQTCTVGGDGYFTLKAGQVAEFSNMLARFDNDDLPKQYFVQELLPNNLTGQYGDIIYTVGGDTGSCKNDTTNVGTDFTGFNSLKLDADIGNLVAYKNVVDTETLSTLNITKTQVGGSISGEPAFYYMQVLLGPDENSLTPLSVDTLYFVGDEIRSVQTAGIICLKAGETAKVKLLAGTFYSVVEVADENGTALTGDEGYTPTYTNASGTVETVGSTVNITVTNTFSAGALELTKIVNNTAGGSTDGEFAFELKFPVEENWSDTDYTVTYTTTNSGQTHTGNMLSFVKQDGYAAATVKLYHGEKITITGLPDKAQVSITETNADGYSVGWSVNGNEVYNKTVTASIEADETVTATCTNTTGYELPNTGGTGTTAYISAGFLLIAGTTLLLLYQYIKRREEDRASS